MTGPITIGLSSSITSFSGAMIERAILKELEEVHSHWDLEINAIHPGAGRLANISTANSLFFTSFHPPSLELLSNLKKIKKWSWNFCLYGNFTELSPYWSQASEILKGQKLNFYALSRAHARFVGQFMEVGKVHVLRPNRINETSFDAHRRSSLREKLHIKDNELVLLYTGRLSLQKQIHFLIDAFERASETRKDLKLILAGNFDDLGDSFSGKHYLYGHYEQYLHRKLSHLPSDIQSRILFVPFQENLLGLYSAADAFVSLSTHHDDDYGVSAIEAMQTGLPVICTYWGGHQDLKSKDKIYVDVHPGLHHRAPDLDQVIDAIRGIKFKKRSLIRPESVSLTLNEDTHTFVGFNKRFAHLAALVKANPTSVFSGDEDFYREIYTPYWEKNT